MQYVENAGGIEHFEIDHFDPRKKKDFLQQYENLYLAKRACNLKKQSNWPSPAEEAQGVRFLDPCKETDYGIHIFEDPATHRVWGITPAGRYQVRTMGLNSTNLVLERKERAELIKIQRETPMQIVGNLDAALVQTLAGLSKKIDLAIPPIEYRNEPAQ